MRRTRTPCCPLTAIGHAAAPWPISAEGWGPAETARPVCAPGQRLADQRGRTAPRCVRSGALSRIDEPAKSLFKPCTNFLDQVLHAQVLAFVLPAWDRE